MQCVPRAHDWGPPQVSAARHGDTWRRGVFCVWDAVTCAAHGASRSAARGPGFLLPHTRGTLTNGARDLGAVSPVSFAESHTNGQC